MHDNITVQTLTVTDLNKMDDHKAEDSKIMDGTKEDVMENSCQDRLRLPPLHEGYQPNSSITGNAIKRKRRVSFKLLSLVVRRMVTLPMINTTPSVSQPNPVTGHVGTAWLGRGKWSADRQKRPPNKAKQLTDETLPWRRTRSNLSTVKNFKREISVKSQQSIHSPVSRESVSCFTKYMLIC